MKVAQNDETNPDTQSVRPPHLPNISNSQLSPSGSSARKHETPGILSRMLSPFTGITYYRVRAHRTPRIALLYFVMLCLLYIYCFSPLFSSVDPETDAAPVIDYVDDDTSSFSAELPGKPPPLIISISPIPFSHDCIRFCYCN